jgi:hypothetical protein
MKNMLWAICRALWMNNIMVITTFAIFYGFLQVPWKLLPTTEAFLGIISYMLFLIIGILMNMAYRQFWKEVMEYYEEETAEKKETTEKKRWKL